MVEWPVMTVSYSVWLTIQMYIQCDSSNGNVYVMCSVRSNEMSMQKVSGDIN